MSVVISAIVLFISKMLAGLFGWDLQKTQRKVAIGIAVVSAILVISVIAGVVLSARACKARHDLKVEQKQLDKINKANEKQRVQELQTIITENADVVTTVDQRNTIANTDETQRNVEIYSKIQEADRKIAESKRQGKDVTGPDLDCILTGANCSQ